MSRGLYIAGIELRSGKSLVALGLMELLSRRISNVGYFRPVIPGGPEPDNNIRLIQSRYDLNLDFVEMYAYNHDVAQSMSTRGQQDTVFKTILAKYRALTDKCKFVLCEGTDFTGVSSAFEFDFNAEVANNLGCPVLVLVNGRDKTLEAIYETVRVARESFQSKGCTILATIVNRVDPTRMKQIDSHLSDLDSEKQPVYIIPEVPALGKPTVGDIAKTLEAEVLQGGSEELNREINDFKVSAMRLPNFLEHLEDGDLIITPGDRADVIIGSMAATVSEGHPAVAGLLLTGGLRPEAPIQRLMEGFRKRVPISIIAVPTDTFTTALNASSVRPTLAPENHRKIAAALGTFETHVDFKTLEERIDVVRSKRVTPIMFEYELIERAKSNRRHIVFPEGSEDRILKAVEILLRRDVVDITLLGDVDTVHRNIGRLGLDLEGIRIIDPTKSDSLERYAHNYFELRKHKGVSEEVARDLMKSANFFGTMMVHKGDADGMVSGAIHSTAETIRPALQIIRAQPGFSVVSGVFLMCLADRVLVYGDCAVNPEPDAEQLADIAISSAETARMYGIEPQVAMCSYSTGDSGKGKDVDKVREATRIARKRRPDLKIEGPIQYDAAVDAGVARTKLPESEVAGKATVFIFPDLNTGNNLYKAVQRSANAVAIGPILQGLNKPVNDLSRGCTIPDIVNTAAITAIQAQAVAD